MYLFRLSQLARQQSNIRFISILPAKHGSFVRNHILPPAKPRLSFQQLNARQQLGPSPQSCYYHSTPLLEQQWEPRLTKIIEMTKKWPVNFQNVENQLALIEKDCSVKFSEKMFFLMAKNCSKMKNHHAAEAAERFVFHWMMKFYQEGRLYKSPDANTFGTAVQAWVNSGHPSSGKRAELLLDKIEDMASEGSLPFPIETPIYNTAMKAYAVHGDVENAQAVFDRCMHAFKQGNESARPDVFTWNTLLDAWAKSKNSDAWKMAEKLFVSMQKSHKDATLKEPPNTITYNSITNACAKSKQPQRAEFWLREMYKDYSNGNVAAQPNERSFSTVIDAWAHSGTEEGADRSEKILNAMILYAKETELPVTPSTVSYSSVMIAYARAGLPRKAEAVLQRQYDDFKAGNKRAALNTQCFTAIIHGWAKAKERISGERAELVLNRMVELHKHGTLMERPNEYTYNAVINTWAMLEKPDKAREVFNRMIDDCKNGNRNAKPSLDSFRALLQAYSNAKLPNAGELADALLEEMKELQLTPDVRTLVPVYRCWECSVGHDPEAPKRVKELESTINKLKAN